MLTKKVKLKLEYQRNLNGGIHSSICRLDVRAVRAYINATQRLQVPLSERPYPTLREIITSLYSCDLGDDNSSFETRYWKIMPDAAYRILELLRPFYDLGKLYKKECSQHLLFRPLVCMDMRMVQYLWDLPQFESEQVLNSSNLYHTIFNDFCYMRLPNWDGLPSVLPESQTEAFELIAAHAQKCNVPYPKHLEFLIEHDFCDFEEHILDSNKVNLTLTKRESNSCGSIWEIHDNISNHRTQDPHELVRATIKSGEYWPLTCICGDPECANVVEPVLSMRFNDSVRWRIVPARDNSNNSARIKYVNYSVSDYLKQISRLLETIISEIESDGFSNKEEVDGGFGITYFLANEHDYKKLQKTLSLAKAELRK